jgi:hypothetical protein
MVRRITTLSTEAEWREAIALARATTLGLGAEWKEENLLARITALSTEVEWAEAARAARVTDVAVLVECPQNPDMSVEYPFLPPQPVVPVVTATFGFGLRDITLTSEAGVEVDLPAARRLRTAEWIRSGEGSGDDRVSAVASMAGGTVWEMEAGEISLEAYALMTGRTALESGLTPGQRLSLHGHGGECFPSFAIAGSSLDVDCGTTTIQLTGCRLTKFEGELRGGEFWVTGCAGVATGWVFTTPIPTRWPRIVYVGTTVLGVYLTENFRGPAEQQPTWRAVNDGLGELKVRVLALDPFDTTARQYCLTNTERTIYRRVPAVSEDWAPILTVAQARTLAGVTAGTIHWVAPDNSYAGRLYGLFSGDGGLFNTGNWLFTSLDYGETWSTRMILDVNVIRQVGNLVVWGSTMWRGSNHDLVACGYALKSANAGVGWKATDCLGLSSWTPWVHVPILDQRFSYVNGNGINGPDLLKVWDGGGGFLSTQVLQSLLHLGPMRSDAMWHSQVDVDFQRVLKACQLYVTRDGWATVENSAPATIVPLVLSVLAPVPEEENWLIFGAEADVAFDHVVLVMEGDTGTTPTGRAGPYPGTPPYLYSIPSTCGQVCYNGIQPAL